MPRLWAGNQPFPHHFAFVHCTRSVVAAAGTQTSPVPEDSMRVAASRPSAEHELVELSREATAALDALLADAVAKVRERVGVEGHPTARLFDREQRAPHGLAWLATYVEAVRQLAAYTERMVGAGTLGEIEEHLVRIALGEYLAQTVGGIPMSQG